MPGLDGLRAISVIAVIVYHLNYKWAPGGFLGVGIFFVLSGYLITDQIITQWKRKRRLNLKDFWLRRARRLLPAMFVMLAFVAVWLLVFDPPRLKALQGDFISALLYINNWWLIFHDVSYFESFGPPSPIGHLWSLAIEEQFYLIWPLILVVGLRIVPKRFKLLLLTLTGAVVSVLAMALIFEPGNDPSRVYYGTDTRAFALLIGAALAVIYPSLKMSENISRGARNILDFIGVIGLLIILLMIWRTDEYGDFLYYGGLMLLSILSAIVIVVLAHPASRLAKFMGCKPLRWLGVRSYSLYIWHYPVIVLTGSAVDTGEFKPYHLILQLGISFLLATLSWKYVEDPIRRGSLRELWGKLRFKPIFRLFLLVIVGSPVLFFMFFNYHLDTQASFQTTIENAIHDMNDNPTEEDNSQVEDHSRDIVKINTSIEDVEPPEPTDIPKLPEPKDFIEIPQTKELESGDGITAIGDSVILDVAPYLEKILPGIVVNGKVGRQMWDAQEVVDQLKSDGKLGSIVIIELGTNGAFNTKQLRNLLTSLEDAQQIVLVNTRVPKKWEGTVNSALTKVAPDFPNTTVVDWYSASMGKKEYFSDDGVHLTREGAEFYASLVAEAIEKEQK